MYFWLDIMSNPLPTVTKLFEEIKSLKNYKDLEAIFHIGWEEGEHNISQYLNTEDGFSLLGKQLNELSKEFGREIHYYLITAAGDDWSKYFDENDPTYRLIKIVRYPTYFFQRTQFRLGPDIQEYWPEMSNNHIAENYSHNKAVTGLDIADLNTGFDRTDFDKTFIFMNLFPKYNRALMMDMLAKHDLHDDGNISWMEYNRNIDRNKIPPGILDSQYEGNFQFKFWKEPKRLYLDQVNETPGPIRWDWLPKEYASSFMQIVGESVFNSSFITEKTVVPLMFNKPFLVASSQNFHKKLEDIGFQLYTEIFDYSFDSYGTIEERCEGIALNVVNVKNMLRYETYNDLLSKIRNKLIHNKKHAHKLTADANFIPKEIFEFLNCEDLVPQSSIHFHNHDVKRYYPYFEYSKKFYNHHLKL